MRDAKTNFKEYSKARHRERRERSEVSFSRNVF